jgi:aminocarboxymuconate-semialdehyde decarboxylase
MTENKQPTVDVHAHVLLPELQQYVAEADPDGFGGLQQLERLRNGLESQKISGKMVGERISKLTDPAVRVADMDATGIDVQVVSPSPSHYYYFADARVALELARRAAHAVRELVDAVPDRLVGLGLVPLQHPGLLMIEALDYAVLECGLAGVELGSYAGLPDGGTIELSDTRLDPFWARVQELDAIVFLHPFGCSLDARLNRFFLANTVAQPAENAVALSHLIFGGVLDRFPELKIIAAHGGGYLPTTMGRSDRAWQVRPEARGCENLPSSYLRRLYFDSLVHSPAELRTLLDAAGPDRVLLGSDYPFDMGSDDPVAAVREAGLPLEDERAVLGGNAALLGLLADHRQTVAGRKGEG